VAEPVPSVVARFRLQGFCTFGEWRYAIFDSRNHFDWFKETWKADADIEEITTPNHPYLVDPGAVFEKWG
jgi:hypothetical protein